MGLYATPCGQLDKATVPNSSTAKPQPKPDHTALPKQYSFRLPQFDGNPVAHGLNSTFTIDDTLKQLFRGTLKANCIASVVFTDDRGRHLCCSLDIYTDNFFHLKSRPQFHETRRGDVVEIGTGEMSGLLRNSIISIEKTLQRNNDTLNINLPVTKTTIT